MHQPAKWWVGLLPVAIVWVVANLVAQDGIETDLKQRAAAVLADNPSDRVADASATVAGRDVALHGKVFGPQGGVTLATDVDDLWGVRLVDAGLTVFPRVQPYVFSAKRDDKRIVLNGYVPLPSARAALVAAAHAAIPNLEVVDHLAYANGAPGDFDKAGASDIAALGKLIDGEAEVEDAAVSLKGTATDAKTRDAVTQDFASHLPNGFRTGTLAVRTATISPYTFGVVRKERDVHLTGYVPDEATRSAVVGAAKARFFDADVVDELKIGPGAPDGFKAAIEGLLAPFSRLSEGHLALVDKKATIDGQAVYAKAADDIKAAFAQSGSGVDVSATIGVKPPGPALDPAACQPKFQDLLAKGHIEFETGSAVVKKDSQALLDDLVAVVQRCDRAGIEVSGHTDTVGNAAANLDLSKRRAQTVVDYLSAAGIDTSRIQATGYGQDKPIASNDTPEGRARNRRIEFQVK